MMPNVTDLLVGRPVYLPEPEKLEDWTDARSKPGRPGRRMEN